MAQRAGWEARLQISAANAPGGPLFYLAVKRWSFTPESPPIRSDNTEGKTGASGGAAARGFASNVANIRSATVMFEEATYDDADSPFAAPYLLREGVFIKVKIFPAGAGVFHSLDQMCITKITVAGEVGQLQPITFEGTSDGNYVFN